MPYYNIPIIVRLPGHADYGGRQCTLTEDTPDLSVHDFNDIASAIAIHPGPNYNPSVKYVVSFFAGPYYTGAQLVLGPGGYDDLSHPYNFNDIISSVKFNQDVAWAYTISPIPVVAELYEHSNYQGRRLIVVQNLQDLHTWADFGDKVSSVKVLPGPNYVPGSQVILFEDTNYSGGQLPLSPNEYPNLGAMGFNDKASSIKVHV